MRFDWEYMEKGMRVTRDASFDIRRDEILFQAGQCQRDEVTAFRDEGRLLSEEEVLKVWLDNYPELVRFLGQ